VKKGAVFDFANKLSQQQQGLASSRSGRESARSGQSSGLACSRSRQQQQQQRMGGAGNQVFQKSMPLPPIAMGAMRPTTGHRNALGRLKMDVLDQGLNLIKAMKAKCPGGTAPPAEFFDTLEENGVHCTEQETMYVVTQLTDGQNQVRYPLFFQVFASMKDHHSTEYAGGYFKDGSYEKWQAQQCGVGSMTSA